MRHNWPCKTHALLTQWISGHSSNHYFSWIMRIADLLVSDWEHDLGDKDGFNEKYHRVGFMLVLVLVFVVFCFILFCNTSFDDWQNVSSARQIRYFINENCLFLVLHYWASLLTHTSDGRLILVFLGVFLLRWHPPFLHSLRHFISSLILDVTMQPSAD